MANLELLVTLLRAVGPRTHVVLVGDADQLAPVGAGKPFAELVAARAVPVAELTHIFRQAAGSMIVRGAHAVRHGEPPSFDAARGHAARPVPDRARRPARRARRDRLARQPSGCPSTTASTRSPTSRSSRPSTAARSGSTRSTRACARRSTRDGQPVLGGRLRIGDKLMLSGRNLHELGLMNGTILRLLEHREDDEALARRGRRRDRRAARGGGAAAPARLRVLGPQGPGDRAAGRDRRRPPGRGRVLPAPRDALHGDDARADGDARSSASAPVVARAAATPDTSRRHSRLGARLTAR